MVRRAIVGSGLDYVEFYASHEAEELLALAGLHYATQACTYNLYSIK